MMKRKKTLLRPSRLSIPIRVGIFVSVSYHLLLFISFIVVYLTDPFESDPEIVEMFVSPILPPSNELPTRLISAPPSLSEDEKQIAGQAKNDKEEKKKTVQREETVEEKKRESKPETVKSTQEKSPRHQETIALRKKQEKKDLSKKAPQKKSAKGASPPSHAVLTGASKKHPFLGQKNPDSLDETSKKESVAKESSTAVSANTPSSAETLQRKKSLSLLGIQQAFGKGRGRLITEDEAQYIDCIKTQVLDHWAVDPHTAGQPVGQAMILVILNREGVIDRAELQTPSGNELYDRAALEAVLKVQPCPPPPTVQSEERRRVGLAIYFP